MSWHEAEMREVEDCKKIKDFIKKKIKKENYENYYNCTECNYIGNGWGILTSDNELTSVDPEEEETLPCPNCYNDFNKLKSKVISDNIEDAAEFFINQIN